jgi:hypothetical protein
MTPVFAWGILGPDSSVKPMCTFLKVKNLEKSNFDAKFSF